MLVGRATVSYSGTPKPALSVSSNGVTVTGLGGANITSLQDFPTNTLNQTNIAFARGGQVWDWNYLNGTQNEISNIAGNSGLSGGPSFGKNVVVFTTLSPSSTYACFYDGEGLVKLGTGTNTVTQRPAYSSAVGFIAGYDAAGDLVVMGGGGGAGTILVPHTSLDFVGQVAWLGANKTVIYQAPVAGVEQLWQIPFTVVGSTITPGTATRVANFTNTLSGAYDLQTAVSPAGNAVCWNNNNTSGQSTLYVTSLTAGTSVNITQPGYNYFNPSFSPDGTQISFIQQDQGTSSNDGSYGVATCLIDGENPNLVATDPIGSGGPLAVTSAYTSWMPFPGSGAKLIGSGGTFGNTASGFLQAQVGDAIGSFLSYAAVTPSTVVVTPAATSSASSSTPGAMVFSVAADNLTSVIWNDGYGLPVPTGQSLSITGSTGLVVSFSGTTGQVLFVAPLIGAGAKTANAAPQMTKTATSYVYSGKFSGVYSKGKNLAPSGASKIEVDQKTGKLVNFS